MLYIIELDNGEILSLSSLPEVKKWIKNNGCMVEPNADMYGLAETIKDQGSVALYESEDTDWIMGRVRIEDAE